MKKQIDKNVKKLIERLCVPCIGRWDCLIHTDNPFYQEFVLKGFIDCDHIAVCMRKHMYHYKKEIIEDIVRIQRGNRKNYLRRKQYRGKNR